MRNRGRIWKRFDIPEFTCALAKMLLREIVAVELQRSASSQRK